jgi:DNA-binding MarR family transcriptional regulator
VKAQPPPRTPPPSILGPRQLRELGGTALAILAIEKREPGIKLESIAAELGITLEWVKKLRRRLIRAGFLTYRKNYYGKRGAAESTIARTPPRRSR